MNTVKICVVGLGYIGLPTSAALASRGVQVAGVDINDHVVDEINAGRVPIVEPDLDGAVLTAVTRGLLSASTSVSTADAFLIAVPTPFREEHKPDLTYVEQAARAIAPHLAAGNTVILESTSPPGTTQLISQWLQELRPDLVMPGGGSSPSIFIAHCPERVLPGRIMVEMVENDRIVGGLTPECARRAAEVYRLFCRGEIILTDATSAEMAKLTENSFRDVNIAFANELAEVSREVGVDVWEVIRLANHHPRVNVLNPGPGVGGHCIAVDPWFIVAAAPEQARLIRTAREVNDSRPESVVEDVKAALAEAPGAVVACLGLAFKANIDDLRESPALSIAERLAHEVGNDLLVVEPHIDSLPSSLSDRPNVSFASLGEALTRARVVLLLVDHDEFKRVSPSQLSGKTVLDTRGAWRDLAI